MVQAVLKDERVMNLNTSLIKFKMKMKSDSHFCKANTLKHSKIRIHVYRNGMQEVARASQLNTVCN